MGDFLPGLLEVNGDSPVPALLASILSAVNLDKMKKPSITYVEVARQLIKIFALHELPLFETICSDVSGDSVEALLRDRPHPIGAGAHLTW
jgi:hypothetical protein